MSIERISGEISSSQDKKLRKILEKEGFIIVKSGHITVKNPKSDHPNFTGFNLPVGYLGNTLQLVNTDVKFPEDYHTKLRKIYSKI